MTLVNFKQVKTHECINGRLSALWLLMPWCWSTRPSAFKLLFQWLYPTCITINGWKNVENNPVIWEFRHGQKTKSISANLCKQDIRYLNCARVRPSLANSVSSAVWTQSFLLVMWKVIKYQMALWNLMMTCTWIFCCEDSCHNPHYLHICFDGIYMWM